VRGQALNVRWKLSAHGEHGRRERLGRVRFDDHLPSRKREGEGQGSPKAGQPPDAPVFLNLEEGKLLSRFWVA